MDSNTWIERAKEALHADFHPTIDHYAPILVRMAVEDAERWLGLTIGKKFANAKAVIIQDMTVDETLDEIRLIGARLNELNGMYAERRKANQQFVDDMRTIGLAMLSAYVSSRIGVPVTIGPGGE